MRAIDRQPTRQRAKLTGPEAAASGAQHRETRAALSYTTEATTPQLSALALGLREALREFQYQQRAKR